VSLPKLLGIILEVAFFYGVVNSAKSTKGVWGWAALLVTIGVGISRLSLVGTDWIVHKVLPLGPIYERMRLRRLDCRHWVQLLPSKRRAKLNPSLSGIPFSLLPRVSACCAPDLKPPLRTRRALF